jgi:hypothetical protein
MRHNQTPNEVYFYAGFLSPLVELNRWEGDNMSSSKTKEIKNRYSHEISEIENILRDLENGRVKDITGANYDGYLANQVKKLRRKLNELFHKVVNESDSVLDEFNKFFK